MIAIVDYGVGNLFSLSSSLRKIGAESTITSNAEVVKKADRIILPGVGAFADAALKLRNTGLDRVILDEAASGKPIFGICLGMQLLFEKSFEYGETSGLGLLKGSIMPMDKMLPPSLKIPHIGWNALDIKKEHSIFKYIRPKDHVYFVHSFCAVDCDESLIATSEYGINVTAAVANGNVSGTQFHPEKSGDVGLAILKGFCEWEYKK